MKVRNMVKRLFAVGTGVAMLGATAMGALAADLGNYPDMFVKDGVFDGYFVVGENAATVDNIALTDIAASMKYLAAGESSTVTVEGDAVLLSTDTNILEFGENLTSTGTYFDEDDLSALASVDVSTSKGNAQYAQYLRFVNSPLTKVVFEEADDDSELTALYLKVFDDSMFMQYHMDFTTSLDSDIDANGYLEDLEDKNLVILGKEYSIISGENTTVKLTLMGGATREVLNEGESATYVVDGVEYDVTLNSIAGVASSEDAKFVVNGELTSGLGDGETYKLDSGVEIGVSDITYQSYAGGIHSAEFFLGADKLELTDGAAIEVNDETITGTVVEFTVTRTSTELDIEAIKVNMTAQDDYWVPVGGKLSENSNLDDAGLLFTQNWDFEFAGLKEEPTQAIELKSTSSEEAYKLTFTNTKGIEISFDLAVDGDSEIDGSAVNGHFGSNDEVLHIAAINGINVVEENEWFILNTDADKTTASYVVQYKGHETNSTSDPSMFLNIVGVANKEISLTSAEGITATGTLSLGGEEFTFTVLDEGTKDSNLIAYSGGSAGMENELWTQYGAKILLTNNAGANLPARNDTTYDGVNGTMSAGDMLVVISEEDTDRMDDMTATTLASYNITASSNELDLTGQTGDVALIESNENEEWSVGYSVFGSYVKLDAGDSTVSDSLYIEMPETQREALVYVTSGATTSATSTGGVLTAVNTVDATKLDSEIADVTMQNLIVVGGPCVNSVAAELMGNPANCADGFTPGVARIKLFENGDYMAMLVAGYSGADTRLAGSVIAQRASDLSGMEVEVEGTSYATATVGAPTVVVAEPVVEPVAEPVVDTE